MAKKKKNNTSKTEEKHTPVLEPVREQSNTKSPFDFNNFTLQAIFLAILGFAIYINTVNNEYALDDGIVIQGNEYVQQGFGGIKKILTTDAYDSFYRQMGASQQLAGGRYRPLSIVTFAMEQSIFGTDENAATAMDIAGIRHFVNVLFYVLSIIILLYFLRNYIFKQEPIIAFLATLIFLIHPIHTEVVANAKSRDEILSFLFIILTFICALNYRKTKQTAQLLYGLLFCFLACLSKEYAVTLVVLVPMLLYIVNGDNLQESTLAALPYLAVIMFYMIIRFKIVGKGATQESPDVLNAPFKFAKGNERLATKIEILNHYLKLVFYPDPLSSDYSYSTIPYKNFKNGWVWLSIAIHLSLVYAAIKLFFKRHILSFAITVYLLYLFLVSNLAMEIGATMGERLIYHSSLGFAIAAAVGIVWVLKKIKSQQAQIIVGVLVVGVITVWSSSKVIARNVQWKNDVTLFMKDVEVVPNSVLVNGNVGKAYYDLSQKPENKAHSKELIDKGIKHLEKAVSIHTRYVNGYINLGVAYFALKDYDRAKYYWDIVQQLYPNNPYLINNMKALSMAFYNEAMLKVNTSKGNRDTILAAIKDLEKAVQIMPDNVDMRFDLGGLNDMVGNHDVAKAQWQEVLRYNPSYNKAIEALKNVALREQQMGKNHR